MRVTAGSKIRELSKFAWRFRPGGVHLRPLQPSGYVGVYPVNNRELGEYVQVRTCARRGSALLWEPNCGRRQHRCRENRTRWKDRRATELTQTWTWTARPHRILTHHTYTRT